MTMRDIYPIDDIETVKKGLLSRGATIAVAESVTAGHLQAALSLAEDARRFFQGGITVYNIGQKCRQLGIEPIHAQDCNGVSPAIAEEMASGVAQLFCSQIGIGITGYAAPVPEKGVDAPYAYYGIYGVGADVVYAERVEGTGKDALEVQLFYVRCVLSGLKKLLESGKLGG